MTKTDKRLKWVEGAFVMTEKSESPIFNLRVCKIIKVNHKSKSTIDLDLKPLGETGEKTLYLSTNQVRLLEPSELKLLGV